ncbi:putative ribonuclease H-like domain-containing protein [Tanacetum coccineum]
MTGNRSYLTNYEEIDGGFVAFGGNSKGGQIIRKGKIKTSKLDFEDVYFVKEVKFNLFSVSQMYDKKNSVLFTDTECVVLKVSRKDNMYNVDLNNVIHQRGLTCLFAKATPDESNLWHRRLGHVNFKTMNKLVRGNLVRGLPSKLFEINQTCVACQKGKQHRASCKTKTVSSISQPLQMLHMDLFGPTFVKSLMKKMYCLVVTDDFSRFSWVFFLATKDETSEILKTFITGIENLIDLRVKVIRCDNGTEFKNRVMNQFCEMKGIKREFSVARTPQQNGVAERKNRTLIEAARTMLADSKLPTTFWAEAVNTACYVQNRVLVIKPHNKTPYELFLGRKPALSFMRPFGCPVTILNTIDHLGKFDGKADEGFFVGYSTNSKAFRVFNSRTRIVEENLHIALSKLRYGGQCLAKSTFCYQCAADPLILSEFKGFVMLDSNHQGKKKRWILKIQGMKMKLEGMIVSTNNINTASDGNSTNNVNAVSSIVNDVVTEVNVVDPKTSIELPNDPNMPELEDIVYVDDIIFGSTKKKLCTEFEKMMHKKFQMSSMGKLTFFLKLQVKQKEDGIFISQDKYVTEILKKFSFSDVKTANTPMKTHKPLLKDADGKDVDEHMYRSMIGSLMYLTSSRPDIIYIKGQPKLGLWYPKVSPFDLVVYTDSYYIGASLDRKSTTGGCQFLGCRLISWQCKKQTVVANSTTEAEYIAASSCCGLTMLLRLDITSLGDSNEKKLIQMIKIHTNKNVADLLTKAFDKGIGVNAGDSKLMLLGINLLLLEKVNALRHNLLLLVVRYEKVKNVNGRGSVTALVDGKNSFWNKQVGDVSTMMKFLYTLYNKEVNKHDSLSHTIITQPSTSQTRDEEKPRKPKRKDTEIPQSSGPTVPIADEAANEENVPTHSNDPLLSAQEILSLKLRVKRLEKKGGSRTHKLKRLFKVSRSTQVVSSKDEGLGDQKDASKQGRKIDDIDQDAEVTLVDETQGRYDDAQMFDTDVFNGEEVFVAEQSEIVVEEVVSTAEVSAAATITTEEITLAQALAELRSVKPKVVVQEPVQSITTTTPSTIPKVKSITFRDPRNLLSSLQAEEEEQSKTCMRGRLIKLKKPTFMLKRKEEKASNLTAQRNEYYNVTYFTMVVTSSQLKNKSFAEIQKLFDKAMTRVNMYVDMDTELVKESSKKAEVEMTQESSSKRAAEELE